MTFVWNSQGLIIIFAAIGMVGSLFLAYMGLVKGFFLICDAARNKRTLTAEISRLSMRLTVADNDIFKLNMCIKELEAELKRQNPYRGEGK